MSKTEKLIVQCLSQYYAKPLVPLELSSIRRDLARSDTSLDAFKDSVSRDPVFCWGLVKAAWEATKNRASHPFAADHAMSILGLGGARKLIAAMPKSAPEPLSQEVIFCLSTSILAAQMAKDLAGSCGKNPQLYWTSLFYQLPETILWYLQPQTMWRFYYRQLTLPKKMALFEESKLGFNLRDWRMAVADDFRMNEQLKQLYAMPQPSNPKELFEYAREGFSNKTPSLQDWHKQDVWLVVLCNRLAAAIITPWHHRSFNHLTEMLAQTTGIELKKLVKSVHASTLKVSQTLHQSPLMNPGVALLMQTSKPQFPDWLVKPQVKKPDPLRKSANTAKHPADKKMPPRKGGELAELINKLTQNFAAYESSTNLVHDGLKALIRLLHFSRVSFLAVDHKNQTVRTRIALTDETSHKIRPDFDFAKPGVLNQFIDKQLFSLLSRESHQAIWTQLPFMVQKDQVERFILCSLQPGSQVRALIYLDAKDPQCFDEKNLTKAKMLLQAINKGLMRRNQAKSP